LSVESRAQRLFITATVLTGAASIVYFLALFMRAGGEFGAAVGGSGGSYRHTGEYMFLRSVGFVAALTLVIAAILGWTAQTRRGQSRGCVMVPVTILIVLLLIDFA
jgi:hypothetical protein